MKIGKTARVQVSDIPSRARLREKFGMVGDVQWIDREPGYACIPVDFPRTSYKVTLGIVSFPELGEQARLTPSDCVSLVDGMECVMRVATLWEQLALLDNVDMFHAMGASTDIDR